MAQIEKGPQSEDGRVVEENFDTLSTHLPGVKILVDHGEDPQNLTRGTTVELRDMAAPYVQRARTINLLTELQKPSHDRFVEIAEDLPGLRGVRDLKVGVEVQINPRAKNVFDEEAIRRSLGERAKEVLHRKVTVTVDLDPDKDNVNGFVRSVERRLERQGSKAKVEKTESTRVDEDALWDMIKDDDVALASGAWDVQIVGHAIVPRKIASIEDREEAEKALGVQERRNTYRAGFSGMTHEEVVDIFNNEVGKTGWTSSRADLLSILHEELIERGIDFSAVGDETSLSFARRVHLSPEGKLVPIPDEPDPTPHEQTDL